MSQHDRDAVQELSDQVVRLARASQAMRSHLGTRGNDRIEWAAYSLLFHLVHDGPKRSSALAEVACVDPSTVSRQVGDLVRAGLVERQPDPEDGRASLLVATAEGRAVHVAKQQRRLHVFSRIVEDWPDEDVASLSALLARFNDSFAARRAGLMDELMADVRPLEETPA
jgi:DNA-binding MarR family transcriptional regulator